jgi:undecaprenyl-diphosphatase
MILVNERFLQGRHWHSPREKQAVDDALKYAITWVQWGTVLTLMVFYRRELWRIALGLIGRNKPGLRLGGNLCVAFLPAGVVGFLAGDWLQAHLYRRESVTVAFLLGGIAILLLEKYRGKSGQSTLTLNNLPLEVALGIGLFQVLAFWPGFSRSLATILGGVLLGLPLITSIHFSFLLGLITLGCSTGYRCVTQGGEMTQTLGGEAMVLGVVISFGVSMATIHLFLGYLKHYGLRLFGYYRLGLALFFSIFAK